MTEKKPMTCAVFLQNAPKLSQALIDLSRYESSFPIEVAENLLAVQRTSLDIKKKFHEVVDKYAVKNDKGIPVLNGQEYTWTDGEKATMEYQDVLMSECIFEVTQIKKEWLVGINIKPETIIPLMGIIIS